MHDAVVVGSGPNGLAAAITLARAGRSVLVREGRETVGGGMCTEELTLPGYLHDTCSAIHPLGVASPFFRSVPLEEHGVAWVHAPAPLAHPLDGGEAVLLERSLEETASGLGEDGEAWRRLFAPLVAEVEHLLESALAPLRPPRHPLLMGRFGLSAIRSAAGLARSTFDGEPARALFAGNAAHSMLPLEAAASASFGLVLALLGHAVGWPLPRGGSGSLATGLASVLRSLGGEIETGRPVESLEELRPARLVLLDVTPRQFLALAGPALDGRYRRALERWRYGPGVVKVDYALSGPVPWSSPECARAATLHLGGTFEEIRAAEAEVGRGRHPERPFVLAAQQSLFDARAPDGGHTLWAYTHVPNGSTLDVSPRIDAQVERFAPGFGELVLGRSVLGPADMEARNPNYVGGDVNGGSADLRQLFARPIARPVPYRTPLDGVYLCSASTPPGGGVHGMCGYHAARFALRHDRRRRSP
jgi:phytoene dehydrogenase-like protein